MIIFGTRGVSRTVESGEFLCPTCGILEEYDLCTETPWFTLYFIPVFPVGGSQRYVQCRGCRQAFYEDVLDLPAKLAGQDMTDGDDDGSTEWQPGDRVLALWPAEQYWYPAVVRACCEGRIRVAYDDGDGAVVFDEEVMRLNIGEGSRVFARWQGGLQYYPAIVQSKNGDNLIVRYEDGRTEHVSMSLVRVLR